MSKESDSAAERNSPYWRFAVCSERAGTDKGSLFAAMIEARSDFPSGLWRGYAVRQLRPSLDL
jgi:hypothetical protein